MPCIASCIAVLGLVLSDIIVPIYHWLNETQPQTLRPIFECYILFVIYIFLPLTSHVQCICLGLATTVCYVLEMALITYVQADQFVSKCFTEIVFLLCVNFFGCYFRLMNEVAIRRAFLDRRECVEGNILLKFARDQEVKMRRKNK